MTANTADDHFASLQRGGSTFIKEATRSSVASCLISVCQGKLRDINKAGLANYETEIDELWKELSAAKPQHQLLDLMVEKRQANDKQ